MSVEIYYFTGTGNTLYITKSIACKLDDVKLIPINKLDNNTNIFSKAEVVGVIYPTYFVDAPDVIHKFLNKFKPLKTSYVFLYTNYGEIMGNALYYPYMRLKAHGIDVDACFHVQLPDNSIIFPTKRELQDKMIEEAKVKIEKDAVSISERNITPSPSKSIFYSLVMPPMKIISKSILGMNKIVIEKDKCINCGICVKVCSADNIKESSEFPIVGDKCNMCFACINYCPKKAIKFKKMKPKYEDYQYVNPDISIEEIKETRKQSVDY